MKKYLTAAVAALALTLSSRARDVDSQNDWVMLTLGWSNGTGAYTMNKGFVPEFANKGQCQVALARALQKDARLSHAAGGGNMYLTAEPYEIERQGGFKPNVFLLSDYGYDTYSTLIVTRSEIVDKRPDLVQRFVDASAIGWYHYLYGDNSKANDLIKTENPDISDDQIAFSIAEMKEHGVVDFGDTLKLGIGAMTDERWKDFSTRWSKPA